VNVRDGDAGDGAAAAGVGREIDVAIGVIVHGVRMAVLAVP
jgi:hypothetical protein